MNSYLTKIKILCVAMIWMSVGSIHAEDPVKDSQRSTGVTYYVDSVEGRNTASGRSSRAPWADFTNINGKVLQPGDKLLIKCGSVINQELQVQVQGRKQAWVEIGAYGKGIRPAIRRNWDITERCARIVNANCLRISGLTFCYAGKGLAVYAGKGQGDVIIEDCVAHHIEGIEPLQSKIR